MSGRDHKRTSHWLMKSEPGTYALADLAREGRARWDGVRNYQARNLMRDAMRVGDRVLFYHSGGAAPGVAGLASVSAPAVPDPSAWEKRSPYYDPRSTPGAPVWWMVEVAYVEAFRRPVSLSEIKRNAFLQGMMVARPGMRLSIQPVTPEHFAEVVRLGRGGGRAGPYGRSGG